MNVHEKLAEIQVNLSAPKGQRNDFAKFDYRSCSDILESVKPHLCGLTIVVSDEVTSVLDRVYVKATATISDGKDSVSSVGYAREQLTKKGMDESQITGSASSYARKYALNGLLAIDDTKDADSQGEKTSTNEAWTISNAKDKYWGLTEQGRAKVWPKLLPDIQKEINRGN
tara:strand:- start:234 stop:746 length:513 start_codon:yes stop_codon:yes gene_type:complete